MIKAIALTAAGIAAAVTISAAPAQAAWGVRPPHQVRMVTREKPFQVQDLICVKQRRHLVAAHGFSAAYWTRWHTIKVTDGACAVVTS